jgi:hypothetical protein
MSFALPGSVEYSPGTSATLTVVGSTDDPDGIDVSSTFSAWNADQNYTRSVYTFGAATTNAVNGFSMSAHQESLRHGPIVGVQMRLVVGKLQAGSSVYFPDSMDVRVVEPLSTVPEPGVWELILCMVAAVGVACWSRLRRSPHLS